MTFLGDVMGNNFLHRTNMSKTKTKKQTTEPKAITVFLEDSISIHTDRIASPYSIKGQKKLNQNKRTNQLMRLMERRMVRVHNSKLSSLIQYTLTRTIIK